MTDSNQSPDLGQPNRLRVDWQEWLALHAVVTRSQPAAGPYHVTVVVTTELEPDHPQIETLLDADRVVIDIETFTDGRVFGLARLLRDRIGFDGDLEVSGDFLPDQISFLERCGVNAFSGEDIVRDAFNFYSGFYQPPRAGIDEVNFIREVRNKPQTA
jgi:uncharacterized protein (DUF934 family)